MPRIMAHVHTRGNDNFGKNKRFYMVLMDVGGRLRTVNWRRREDSNLCISESEFAQTLSSGREKSNMRISIERCRVAPRSQRKPQAMIDSRDLVPKCRG